ncbi:hypothetical protein Tco_0961976 [Tanacetum coccineum]
MIHLPGSEYSMQPSEIDAFKGPEDGKEQEARTQDFNRLSKVGILEEFESYEDKDEFGVTEDASKQEVVFKTLIEGLIEVNEDMPSWLKTRAGVQRLLRENSNTSVEELHKDSQPSMIKGQRQSNYDEPEVPLKRKDQVALNEDLARNLQAQLEANLIEEERLARKKEEQSNISLIESWDNT